MPKNEEVEKPRQALEGDGLLEFVGALVREHFSIPLERRPARRAPPKPMAHRDAEVRSRGPGH